MMEKIKRYNDLLIWQHSMELAKKVYAVTSHFPKEELYGLTSQMRRASVSVAANIAEGHARNTTGEFRQFLGIARGSLAELETLIILSDGLGLMLPEAEQRLLEETEAINKMLNSLLRSLASR
jgi:four helix bundle protein